MSALSDLSAALLPPEAGGPDPHRVAASARILLDRMPARQRLSVAAGLAALEAGSVATSGKALGRRPAADRARFVEGIARSGPLGSAAIDALKTLTLLLPAATSSRPRSARPGPSIPVSNPGSVASYPPSGRRQGPGDLRRHRRRVGGRRRLRCARAGTRRPRRPDRRGGRALDVGADPHDPPARAVRLALPGGGRDDRPGAAADRAADGTGGRRHYRRQLRHLLSPARPRRRRLAERRARARRGRVRGAAGRRRAR